MKININNTKEKSETNNKERSNTKSKVIKKDNNEEKTSKKSDEKLKGNNDKKLVDNNYAHYEVSNFAREGYESKHNIGYWKHEDFLGLSLGASSKINNHRFTNTNKFNLYFNDYNETIEDIVLTKDELMFENIMMSLRMKDGLNIKEFNDKYNCDFESRYKKALSNPFIDIDCGMVKCNRLEILNTVLLDFMED